MIVSQHDIALQVDHTPPAGRNWLLEDRHAPCVDLCLGKAATGPTGVELALHIQQRSAVTLATHAGWLDERSAANLGRRVARRQHRRRASIVELIEFI